MKKLKIIVIAVVLFSLLHMVQAAVAADEIRIEPNQAVTDNLGSEKTVNTYRMNFPQPGSLQVELDFPVGGHFNVEIIKVGSDGTLSSIQKLNYSTDRQTTTGKYTLWGNKLRVAAGDYYIKVRLPDYYYGLKFSSNDYQLTMRYSEEPGNNFEKQPNGSTQLATAIQWNTSVTGNLESNTDVDYYKVTFLQPGSLQVELDFPINGDFNVEVIRVGSSSELSSIQNTIYRTDREATNGRYALWGYMLRVAAGDYYIKVSYPDYYYGIKYSSGDYRLKILHSDEPGNDFEKEPNSSVQSATVIQWNAPVTGNLENSSDVDYYKVTLPQRGSLQVELDFSVQGDFNVEVIEVGSNSVLSVIQKAVYRTDKEISTGRYKLWGSKLRVSAGDYYIKVSYPDYYYGRKFSYLNYKLKILSDIKIMAVPATSTLLVDGKPISFDGYLINNSNYFKLRDLAFVLNGTSKQFEVSWANNAISLNTSEPYTPSGTELKVARNRKALSVVPNRSKIYINGKPKELVAYTINNNNYFKLRDLAQELNFAVGWDGSSNAITIETDKDYR